VLLSVLVAITGCGGGRERTLEDELESTDADLVRRLVSELSDVKGRPERFRALFAEGAVPAESEQSRYVPYVYRATSTVVDGERATVSVRVENATDETFVGEVEWIVVKEGDRWRLKAAPPE
jgi:hypothetical protein